ncbi:hypothetical protein ACD591_12715 [Rufibacter glacialis]|uniref:Uncharacterized protein n=1 Tax=Rufibacter glacialis TaxID=1259555 RepID=A0A5M8QPK1_9BACT|nr:hypothetical protein [Rufibacter glacialis]KAA6437171.1 hypothetical protein FOE74_01355 [Rufibacter glacialis]GGK61511.1 hypothetical protein GCM10011405_07010 [Rufibacter glacialis]
MAPRGNFDDEYGYDEDDLKNSHFDDEFSLDDEDDDDLLGGRGGFGPDDDEEVNLPYEGELFNEMLSKLHGTLIMYGEDDPALMDLQAELLQVDADKVGTAADDMFYLEEASQIAKVLKRHLTASPKIKEIHDNFMKDITRFSDEKAEGHAGDYYLEDEE